MYGAHVFLHFLNLSLLIFLQVFFEARLGEYALGALLRHLVRHLLRVMHLVVVVAHETAEYAPDNAYNNEKGRPKRPKAFFLWFNLH